MWNIKLKQEGDQLVSVRHQYERQNILDTLQRARNEGLAPKDRPGLGRWALSVPAEDWLRLRAKYPDLQCPDGKIQSAAWQAFIRSDESLPYRMRERI